MNTTTAKVTMLVKGGGFVTVTVTVAAGATHAATKRAAVAAAAAQGIEASKIGASIEYVK